MKQAVLIVDDVELNRLMLETILSPYFDTISASNGLEAYSILQQRHQDIYVVLLDLVMPDYDGITLLKSVYQKPWFVNTAFIVVSVRNDVATERQCFDLGVTDFVHKPYDKITIQKRVTNAAKLINYQRNLQARLSDQSEELIEQNRMLKEYADRMKNNCINVVNLLGIVVESRDAESGEHILRVRRYTEILCKYVQKYYPEYGLDDTVIDKISIASPLHDIGKIGIPDSILLKSGKLSELEFELMKQHTKIGAEIIYNSHTTFENEFRKIASDICLYHHERYDGNGYPTGLAKDDIPIAAQIVGVADVYDALVHKRIYKTAIAHDQALKMIVNGECGVFNPKLIDCLEKAQVEFEQMNAGGK